MPELSAFRNGGGAWSVSIVFYRRLLDW